MKSKPDYRLWAKNTRKIIDVKLVSPLLTKKLLSIEAFTEASQVLLYAPLPGEVDTLSLLSQCSDKIYYLPKIVSPLQMSFYQVDTASVKTLVPHPTFKVPEPLGNSRLFKKKQNGKVLVVVPALAVDEHGIRLGYGKGFYDRFLASFIEDTDVCFVSLVPQALILKHLPAEPWDCRLDVVVTEQQIYTF